MVYAPPIKKRQYINAITRAFDQKIIAHDCARCHMEYPIKAKGIWFERADQHDVWCWVCKACCERNGIIV